MLKERQGALETRVELNGERGDLHDDRQQAHADEADQIEYEGCGRFADEHQQWCGPQKCGCNPADDLTGFGELQAAAEARQAHGVLHGVADFVRGDDDG